MAEENGPVLHHHCRGLETQTWVRNQRPAADPEDATPEAEATGPYHHQHVGDGDDVRLVPGRHGRLKVVAPVFHVGHCVVVVEGDVVLLDAFSG